jgi:hypothetical protein
MKNAAAKPCLKKQKTPSSIKDERVMLPWYHLVLSTGKAGGYT